MLTQYFPEILAATGASQITKLDCIQSLWSGYGEIVRVHLTGAEQPSVVVKHICLPKQVIHPRGWHSNLSHQRKINSYVVEAAWYNKYAQHCNENCPVPMFLGSKGAQQLPETGQSLIILSDLAVTGFSEVKTSVTEDQIEACISWLAQFHGKFLHSPASDLWSSGSYWHLATRPDELKAMAEQPLKQAAPILAKALSQAQYKTIIHGDAKLANFCFKSTPQNSRSSKVAAVDFQYVGAGVGVQDLAYFLGSCLTADQLEKLDERLLTHYFNTLRLALTNTYSELQIDALEAEWRSLYDVAWADFQRFLLGWQPTHWKLNAYSKRLTEQALTRLL